MSKKSQDKRRARAKEKAARARKQKNASPLAMLSNDPAECWCTYMAEDMRMLNIVAFRKSTLGDMTAAFFLIDFDCIGVKDAFYELDVSRSNILEHYKGQVPLGATVRQLPLDEVRSIVAGATRWTQQNHFRVPAQLPRCLTILGGDVEIATADVSDFGDDEGGLLYVGQKIDLQRRLTDTTLEEFLKRKDVTTVFGDEDDEFFDDDESMLDDAPDTLSEAQTMMQQNFVEAARQWCLDNNKIPHGELAQAVAFVLDAMQRQALPKATLDEDDEAPEMDMPAAEAMEQFQEFIQSFKSPEDLFKGIRNGDAASS